MNMMAQISSHLQLSISIFIVANLNLAHSFNVPAIFIFGDSIFDAGNNHFNKNCSVQADFPPYGLNFFHHPTGRFTNGRTVADFLAQFLGLELQLPYLLVLGQFRNGSRKAYPSNGINFASAGSGVLQQTNQHMGVTPLGVQVQQFHGLIHQNQTDKKLVENSIFLLESGSNDIFNYFLRYGPPKPEPDTYIQAMLSEVVSFINQIYQLGARRIAIFSLGPLGCAPARAMLPQAPLSKCYGRMNRMIKDYNSALEKLVTNMPAKYPSALGVYGAVYRIIQQLRTTPTRYGFAEVTSACCGNGPLNGTIQCGQEGSRVCPNPNQYLFWDYFHPSERTYRLTAKALWEGGHKRIKPFNLKTLAGLRPQRHAVIHGEQRESKSRKHK